MSFNEKEYRINYRKAHPWLDTWWRVFSRCTRPQDKDYSRYGGRGIKCLITKIEVKVLYFRDKAYLMKQPSIDRKNNNGDYTFDNCQFIEHSLNSSKDKGHPILQYTLDGKFIREWSTSLEIEKELNIGSGNIRKLCTKKAFNRQAGGFRWKHAE